MCTDELNYHAIEFLGIFFHELVAARNFFQDRSGDALCEHVRILRRHQSIITSGDDYGRDVDLAEARGRLRSRTNGTRLRRWRKLGVGYGEDGSGPRLYFSLLLTLDLVNEFPVSAV
jgi:hypothetical protein